MAFVFLMISRHKTWTFVWKVIIVKLKRTEVSRLKVLFICKIIIISWNEFTAIFMQIFIGIKT